MRNFIKGIFIWFCCLCMNTQAQTSGKCGDNARWEFNEETGHLTITGTGRMDDMGQNGVNQPWYHLRESTKKIIIEEGITSIGYFSFSSSSAKSISLPTTLTNITWGGFSRNEELEELTIPENVESIGAYNFRCSNLKRVICKRKTPPGKTLHDNEIDFIRNCTLYVPYESIELYKKADIWKDFKNIKGTNEIMCGDEVFWEYKNDTLRLWGEGEIWANSRQPWYDIKESIRKVIVEEGITSLGYNTFAELWYMNEVKLPESLTRIGMGAFQICESLRSLTIPKNVTSIAGVFIGGAGIENLICLTVKPPSWAGGWPLFEGVDVENIKVTVPIGRVGRYREADQWNGIKNISDGMDTSGICGDDAYWGYKESTKTLRILGTGIMRNLQDEDWIPWKIIRHNITNAVVEEGITGLGAHSLYESSVENVYLPSTLISINKRAFIGTDFLKRLILPENVEYLNHTAMSGMSLNVLYCLNRIPPTLQQDGLDVWLQTDTSNITLYVRSECVDAYKADPGWSGFKEILPLDVPNKIERVKGVSLPTKIIGRVGDTIRLTEYVEPASAAVKHLYIDSAEHNVVKPLQDGSVVLVGGGKYTEITVRTVDGGYISKSTIRILNDNANLKNLAVKEIQELEFDSDVIDYHATVGWNISKLSITAIAEDSSATVKLGSQTLNVGNNTIIITVTAEDGSVKDYTLHIYRKSSEARLKSLEINQGSLEPAFTINHKDYIWRAKKKDSYPCIWAEAMDDKASVTETEYGNNGKDTTFLIKVTAEDERFTDEYEVKLKLYNDNAFLKELRVEGFELNPEFQPHITKYEVKVPHDTRDVKVVAIPQDSNATIIGNIGWQYVLGSENIYSIDVMAEDRETHEYYYIHVSVEGLKTAIEHVEKQDDEEVKIYSVDGKFLGTTKTENGKVVVPKWLGRGVFIAKGSKYREKFTN